MSTTTRQAAAVVAALAAILLPGCASVPSDARFAAVRDAASARLEQNVVWNRDPQQDASARAAVQRLLQHELSADAAVQIALLNNRELQSFYARVGIAQADLVAGCCKIRCSR